MNYWFTAMCVLCPGRFQCISGLLQCLFCVQEGSSELQVYCSVCFVSWKVPVNYKVTAVCVFCVLEGSSELQVYCSVWFVFWKVQ